MNVPHYVYSRTARVRHQPKTNTAFSLAETAIATMLVAGLLVVALNTVGDTTLGHQKTGDRGLGHLLGHDLMAEVLAQNYEEPVDTPAYGCEPGESSTSRAEHDDVDDYHGWQRSPPQYRDGTVILNLDGWERSVQVHRVSPTDLDQILGAESGVKRITVTVSHNEMIVAKLVAIRTPGLPPPKLGPRILLVVGDPANLTTQESARVTLMESWDCIVELMDDSDSQSNFDAAAANADVAYISAEISALELNTKLRAATIGLVNERIELTVVFGFGEIFDSGTRDVVEVVDNTHYITAPFSVGFLTLFSPSQPVHWRESVGTSDALTLCETNSMGGVYKPSLATLKPGDLLWDGGTASGRRVQLPWGADGFDFNSLNSEGLTLMKRAIEWAASQEQP